MTIRPASPIKSTASNISIERPERAAAKRRRSAEAKRRRRDPGCSARSGREPAMVDQAAERSRRRSGGVVQRAGASTGPTIQYWSGKRDSNPRLRPWQGRTLPLSYSRPPAHHTSPRASRISSSTSPKRTTSLQPDATKRLTRRTHSGRESPLCARPPPPRSRSSARRTGTDDPSGDAGRGSRWPSTPAAAA